MKLPLQLIAMMILSVSVNAQEIGVQLYSFRNQIPKGIPGTMQKIRMMGISELEGGGTYGLPQAKFRKMSQEP